MELLFNDLSIHSQFPDLPAFREAMIRLMGIRSVARQFGREVQCHRNVANAQVTHRHCMQQAINIFNRDEQRAVMQWLTRQGPFWEEARVHSPDDYLECNGEVVTDTAVGEAAYCCFNGVRRSLVSLTPSSWMFSPILVTWIVNLRDKRDVYVVNHWDVEELEAFLRDAPAPLASWEQLELSSRDRCPNLTFSEDCFHALRGHPFVQGAAHRVLSLLELLDQFKMCFDEGGQRTPKGHWLYKEHFTGVRGRFSDSSDVEKRNFEAKLTFRHPEAAGETLFCTWHGKVQTPQLRIHFSWPVVADKPLYVVYVGPKITKR